MAQALDIITRGDDDVLEGFVSLGMLQAMRVFIEYDRCAKLSKEDHERFHDLYHECLRYNDENGDRWDEALRQYEDAPF